MPRWCSWGGRCSPAPGDWLKKAHLYGALYDVPNINQTSTDSDDWWDEGYYEYWQDNGLEPIEIMAPFFDDSLEQNWMLDYNETYYGNWSLANDTLNQAFERAFDQGNAAMYIASDLPFIKASDVHSVLQASRQQNNISLAPARRDGGTNAILVPHGTPFRAELGGKSFIKHLSQAANMGISVAICYSPGLGFDLDTPDDLETYEHMEPGLIERLLPGRTPKTDHD